jgi:hypothetical protein
MLARRLLALLPLCLLAACNDGVTLAPIEMRVLDADGNNPVDDIDDGTLTVQVRHQDELLDCDGDPCTSEIHDGDYQLDLPIASFAGRTEVQVVLQSDDRDRWIGAMPPFQPGLEGIERTGVARIIVGTPSSCHTLTLDGLVNTDPPALGPPRRNAAAVVRRNLVLVSGGIGADGAPDGHVDRFDELLIDRDALPTLEETVDIGRAHGVAINEDVSLVVGDASAWLYVKGTNGPPLPQNMSGVMPGRSFESALVSLATGAAIVGGPDSASVQWVDTSGAPSGRSTLEAPRTSAAAAAMIGNDVLVVGGNDADHAAAEWVPNGDDGEGLSIDSLPLARGGYLLPSPDGTAAIWIGFEQDGAPSSDVYVFRGCPDACTAEPSELRWDRARTDVAAVVTEAGALWLVGGADADGRPVADVDIVRWVGDAPSLEAGPALEHPRVGATAFEHAAGIVTVTGGQGEADDGLRADFEMCFPSHLDPP